MRKLTLSLICLFTIAFSQDNMNDDMGIKVYVGASSMTASIDSPEWQTYDAGRKIGFNIGLMKPLNDKVTVGGGYTKRGWTDRSFYEDLGNVDEEWEVSAVELWATYNLFNLANGINFWVGPSFAILNNIDADFTFLDSGGVSVSDDADIDDNELSLMLGVSFPSSGSNYINIGYQRSLREVDGAIIFNQFFIDYSFGL